MKMTLLDLFVTLIVLLFAMVAPLPFGVPIFLVCALIIERLVVGDRPVFRRAP